MILIQQSPPRAIQATSKAYCKYDDDHIDFLLAKVRTATTKPNNKGFSWENNDVFSKKLKNSLVFKSNRKRFHKVLTGLICVSMVLSLHDCSNKLRKVATEKAPLIINLGRGTTGTRSFTEAICSLGVPSVHFNKHCVSHRKSFDDVSDDVMVGVGAHYNLRDHFNKLSIDCLTMGTSCPDVMTWVTDMRRYVDTVVSSDIGAVLDTPYPYIINYVIQEAEKERGVPPIIVMTERDPKSWADSRLLKNDHNCLICKENLEKFRASDGNSTFNNFEGVFDIFGCIERAQTHYQNSTIHFRDIFLNTKAIDHIQKRMILKFVEKAFNYYQVSLQSKTVYNLNMFERTITTHEMATELLEAISLLPDSRRRLRHVQNRPKPLRTDTLKGEILKSVKGGGRPLKMTQRTKSKLRILVNNDKVQINANKTTENDAPDEVNDPSFLLTSDRAPLCKPIKSNDINYTLVTQLSEDRLWMLNQHCSRWNGSISAAIFTDKSVDEIQKSIRDESTLNGGISCGEEQVIISTIRKDGKEEDEYPVNELRNLALSAVTTSHVMYLDVDFWGSSDLHEILQMDQVRKELARNHKHSIVVPSFMMNPRFGAYPAQERRIEMTNSLPTGIAEVKKSYESFQLSMFGSIRAQSTTDYVRWFEQELGSLVPIPCFKSIRFEPYMAFRYCKDLPPFQEVFTGYGKNKITQIMQMRHTGYSFSQLGGAYLIHFPHGVSSSKEKWSQKPETSPQKLIQQGHENELLQYKHGQVDKLYLEFKKWLDDDIKNVTEITTPLCEDHFDDDEGIWASTKSKN